jgi:hypothetical protein
MLFPTLLIFGLRQLPLACKQVTPCPPPWRLREEHLRIARWASAFQGPVFSGKAWGFAGRGDRKWQRALTARRLDSIDYHRLNSALKTRYYTVLYLACQAMGSVHGLAPRGAILTFRAPKLSCRAPSCALIRLFLTGYLFNRYINYYFHDQTTDT